MKEQPGSDEITLVDFKCPHCGNPVSFPDRWIGKAQECPTCWQILIVPDPGVEIGRKLPLPFKTARMQLRRFLPVDAKDLIEIATDKELLRYLEWDPVDPAEEVAHWLEKDRNTRLFQRGHNFYMALELIEQPKVIGYVALTYLDKENSEMYTHLIINRIYQRRGFGTEAVRGAIHLAFANLGIRRLCAWCDPRDLASTRMLEKAGMRKEGQFIKERFLKGEWVDSFQFALLRDEYVSAA